MSKEAEHYLKSLQPLIHKASCLDRIATELKPILTDNNTKWRIGNYEKGTLTLLTTDAAYATQLRFLCPHLLNHLRKNAILPDIAQIKIKVMPFTSAIPQPSIPKTQRKQNKRKVDASLKHFPDEKLKRLLAQIYTYIGKKP